MAAKPTKTNDIVKQTTITPTNFVIYSILTLGLYQAYWGWRAWESVRRTDKETYKFRSSLRGLFLVISSFFLFPRLKELAEKKGLKSNTSPGLFAALYLLTAIATTNQYAPLSLMFAGLIVSTGLLLPFVQIHNSYVEATKSKYTPDELNKWFIIFLVLCWLLTIATVIIPTE